VYGRGNSAGFLHVRDWVRAALTVLERGRAGVRTHRDGTELSNLELAERIVALVGALTI